MWLETRNARTVTDVLRRVTIEWPPVAVSLGATQQLTELVDMGLAEYEAPHLPSVAPSVSLLPSRSPPLRRFCLA